MGQEDSFAVSALLDCTFPGNRWRTTNAIERESVRDVGDILTFEAALSV
jgi:hypothetical protein